MDISAGTGELIRLGGIEVVFYAAGRDTDGHADVYEVRVAPGAKVPTAHHHVEMDEIIVGLEGVMTYVVGDTVHEVGPGQRVFSPRGVVHYFANRSAAPARVLIVGTPGILGPEYFREIQSVVAAGGPPDPAKIGAVMRRFGLEPKPLPSTIQL